MAWTSGIADWKMMNMTTTSPKVFYTSGDIVYASGATYDTIRDAPKKPKSEVDLLDERVRKVCKAGRL